MPRKRSRIVVPLPQRNDPIPPAEPRSFVTLDLTERQLEVLGWVYKGKSGPDIGDILGISYRTVEHHIEAACLNLNVGNRYQAVIMLHDLGLIGAKGP